MSLQILHLTVTTLQLVFCHYYHATDEEGNNPVTCITFQSLPNSDMNRALNPSLGVLCSHYLPDCFKNKPKGGGG